MQAIKKNLSVCCREETQEGSDQCLNCGGVGEVIVMERIYRGEPHIAPVESAVCEDCHGSGLVN